MAAKKSDATDAICALPSCSSSRRWSYDVFLSFRGEDTRKNFTDHLYFALKDAGINAFRDDNELRRGKDIATELVRAIQDSRVSLIVFSRNYAASKWCLEELVKIMECQRTAQHVVLPIFYNVDPSDVRKQTGTFAEAFSKHEERFAAEMDKVLRWRAALTQAANLSGWDLTSAEDGYEAKIVKKIVKEILSHLNNTPLNVTIYPVGIDSRLQEMNLLLNVGLNNVRIIGICAMGGMGKTTIAKAIYNQFFHNFEGKSFLANVREISKQPNGQIRLQQQLLFDILRTKKMRVSNVDRGINVIKERLCNRRVLVVLDDIDQLEQLNALAGKHDWFGFGSRIIITTRDVHLLKEIEVDDIYMVRELNHDESLELFCWHAFRKSHPKEDYVELSKDVMDYCKGLPLALEVLGSFLFHRCVPEWKSALDKLKKIPPDQIQKKLRISFDALEDDKEKDIFLDIACFFIGMDKDYVVKILDACGFFAEIGISVLICRSLLTINKYNELTMHDLLRDMGREIVREESPKQPEHCSRLWFYDDVVDVLAKHKGTQSIEGLILNLPTLNEVHLSTEAFSKMQKLRLLQLNYVRLSGSYDHFSKELRWLCWHGFPLKFIPNGFHVENLVAIDLQYSNLRQVWKETKFLGKLKVLNLSHSHYLTNTPNFLQFPTLEKLILIDCTRMVEVHPSIGHLDRLVLLNMRDCKHLKNLPRSICMLKCLEIIDLSGCSQIEKLPEDLGEMEALIQLLANGTAIRQIPASIVRLTNLRNLSLCGCKGLPSSTLASVFWSWVSSRKTSNFTSLLPASLQGLSSLTTLSLDNCNLLDEAIPKDFGSLFSLRFLNLRGNNFCSLPASISNLPKLRFLSLDHCTRLQSLPDLPTSLRFLYAINCTSLERLLNLSRFERMPELFLMNCHKLVEIPGLEKLESIGTIRMEGCNNLANPFKDNLLQGWSGSAEGSIFLPGDEIPNWFSHQCMGSSLSFQVPPSLGCKLKGFNLSVVYASDINIVIPVPLKATDPYPSVTVIVKTNGLDWIHMPTFFEVPIPPPDLDLTWVGHLPHSMFGNQLDSGNQVEVVVDLGYGLKVKKCGVHLVYDQDERISQSESDGGELIMYNSTSNKTAIVAAHDEGVSEHQARSKVKRDRNDDDDEGGPSHGWFDKDQHPKRFRYQAGSSMNINEE
ncbi:hypothetical protein L1049_018034 [Liquidambar formosana]|uniref:ADP-ribosyl cyclase/cyclic ADP-ribose hydrolase n=1 Tax=Liquidambar formosana TaxID=63359 RepID=A0AAP0NH37_LIQFO